MTSARESIEIYLRHKEVAEDRRLAVAILFAESLVRELGASVAEWQEAASRLRRLKRDTTLPCSNRGCDPRPHPTRKSVRR
jgi:hypothetical protein